MTIKAIIFDIGGVIYLGKQNSHEYVQKKLKIPKENYFDLIEDVWESLVTGRVKNRKGFKTMAKRLKISDAILKQIWVEAIKKRFILNNQIIKIIKQLKKHYKTAILSDQWFIPYKILINKNLKKNFSVFVFSHKVGFRKPSSKIYKEAVRKLSLKPKQCIFIDNQEWNLTPAKKLGMKTILFKNNRQLVKDLAKLGVK